MKGKPRILFLYTELSSYFLACAKTLAVRDLVEVHVVHWPVNREAPFDFSFPGNIFLYDRKKFSARSLVLFAEQLAPSVIYSSGWIDKSYLVASGYFKRKIPTIVGLDTRWRGGWKQKMAVTVSPFTLKHCFTHCWVTGSEQLLYAQKLGFSQGNILLGMYSADVEFFRGLHQSCKPVKFRKYPRRFIYAGRYYTFKGIKDLWSAFIEWQETSGEDWELWCLGTGDVEPVSHPKIKHFGFVQPSEMGKFISETGVFVLPSRFEPWGVVLHEFVSAGFPVICSDAVGAAELFVRNGENGFIFRNGKIQDLKNLLQIIAAKSDDELLAMGEKSVALSGQITPEKWADNLLGLLHQTTPHP